MEYLIYANWFSIEFNHVKHLDGLQQKSKKISKQSLICSFAKNTATIIENTYIVSILFTPEFNKSITLMLVGHPVFRDIHIN